MTTKQKGPNHSGDAASPRDVHAELEEAKNEAAALSGALENLSTPFMMVDRDFVVTYANQATTDYAGGERGALCERIPRVPRTEYNRCVH